VIERAHVSNRDSLLDVVAADEDAEMMSIQHWNGANNRRFSQEWECLIER
jgi:hypothetical protein